jgi:2-keto-4-pentenoate hydratase/2-oxohepta-3-ene-1,7-dioic acid hydratase in catechol pathway
MRFATLQLDGRLRPVAIADDLKRFVDVRKILPGFDGDMVDLIAQVPEPDTQLAAALASTDAWTALDGHKLAAPVAVRRNIFCVGKNYHEHAKEFSNSGFDTSAQKGEIAPPFPVVFTKPYTTVVANHDTVNAFENVTEQLDYEAELAVIIGKPGIGITKANALDHVWGYTIVNDVTARDLQQKHRQWFIGKSLDTFCPMGPYLVTAKGIDSTNLKVRCWINGELRQDANTSDLIFDIPTIIEALSGGMSLLPGDVIATGTPAGVGIGFKPPRFLKKGDTMKLEIDQLGVLENTIG